MKITTMATFFGLVLIATITHTTVALTSASASAQYLWESGFTLPDGSRFYEFQRPSHEPGFKWVGVTYDDNRNLILPHWEPLEYPDSDTVWERGYVDSNDIYQLGFWRDAHREGFVWVEGYYDEHGYVLGHWEPIEPTPTEHIYVYGYPGPDSHWVSGFWRPAHLPGFVWIHAYFVGHTHYWGHWEPTAPSSGRIWVPGHVGPAGYWVTGFWRPRTYAGFVWACGYYSHGTWTLGHWSPRKKNGSMRWVPGHVHNGHWVAGYWRAAKRLGYSWINGYYHEQRYHEGRWAKQSAVHYPSGATPTQYAKGSRLTHIAPTKYAEPHSSSNRPIRYAKRHDNHRSKAQRAVTLHPDRPRYRRKSGSQKGQRHRARVVKTTRPKHTTTTSARQPRTRRDSPHRKPRAAQPTQGASKRAAPSSPTHNRRRAVQSHRKKSPRHARIRHERNRKNRLHGATRPPQARKTTHRQAQKKKRSSGKKPATQRRHSQRPSR